MGYRMKNPVGIGKTSLGLFSGFILLMYSYLAVATEKIVRKDGTM